MEYRLYVLDSAGKFADVEDWTSASDEEAMERASRHVHSFGAELWQGKRKLSTFSGLLKEPGAAESAARV